MVGGGTLLESTRYHWEMGSAAPPANFAQPYMVILARVINLWSRSITEGAIMGRLPFLRAEAKQVPLQKTMPAGTERAG